MGRHRPRCAYQPFTVVLPKYTRLQDYSSSPAIIHKPHKTHPSRVCVHDMSPKCIQSQFNLHPGKHCSMMAQGDLGSPRSCCIVKSRARLSQFHPWCIVAAVCIFPALLISVNRDSLFYLPSPGPPALRACFAPPSCNGVVRFV